MTDNVRQDYSANKDFFVSLVDSYIVEAILTHFGMTTINDVPTKNLQTDQDRDKWLATNYQQIADRYIAPSLTKTLQKLNAPDDVEGI